MKKQVLLLISVLFVLILGFLVANNFGFISSSGPITINETTVPPLPKLNPASVASGKQVYAQYCAACHGVDLQGVPSWKIALSDGSFPPPPHDSSGHSWHHPDSLLIEIITVGGDPNLYVTKMPGFGDQLTDSQIRSVLDYIKSTWGREQREFQWWLTAREE